MPAHFAGLPRSVSFAFIVIAVTRGFTDATATRASFTLATLRDLILPGMAASFSFQVRSSEVVWISMIFLRGLHLFVLPARCQSTCRARRELPPRHPARAATNAALPRPPARVAPPAPAARPSAARRQRPAALPRRARRRTFASFADGR